MNQKNFEFLSNQLKYVGFGEALLPQLKSKIEQGEKEFTLGHAQEFGKQSSAATLHFRKSEETGLYFFNKYNFLLKKSADEEPVKQTFYINANDRNITYKEAYNLLNGRAVHKELTNKEGEKYKAWLQLDFAKTEANGNFEVKRFYPQYGFDLGSVLQGKPIQELASKDERTKLVDALERGNRYPVTFEQNGRTVKGHIEAAPQFKSLNYYNEQHKRTNYPAIVAALGAGREQGKEKQQEQRQEVEGPGEEVSEAPAKSKRRGKKSSM